MVNYKIKNDHQFKFFNKFLNKKIEFLPKKDEYVVTFKPNSNPIQEIESSLPLTVSRGINIARGFGAFKVTSDIDIESTFDNVTDVNVLSNTIPVLTDDEGLKRYFLPDEFDVQFDEGLSENEMSVLISQKNCQITRKHETYGYYTLGVPHNKGLFEIIKEFSDLDEVIFAEPSEVGFNDHLDSVSSEHLFKQWGLKNNGQIVNGISGTTGADIKVLDAWTTTSGDPRIIVCIIDTGIDMDHPDLIDSILQQDEENWNFQRSR